MHTEGICRDKESKVMGNQQIRCTTSLQNTWGTGIQTIFSSKCFSKSEAKCILKDASFEKIAVSMERMEINYPFPADPSLGSLQISFRIQSNQNMQARHKLLYSSARNVYS